MKKSKRMKPAAAAEKRNAAPTQNSAAKKPRNTAQPQGINMDPLRLEAERLWAASDRKASQTAKRQSRRVTQKTNAAALQDELARAKNEITRLEQPPRQSAD